jgi:predicted nucleic acid-binding protein
MTALFAGTFYWVALADVAGNAHQRALALTSERARSRIVTTDEVLTEAGLQLYRARPDKGYSLVDCISMQAMRREGLTEVLTNDRHFEQKGFRALFRDS